MKRKNLIKDVAKKLTEKGKIVSPFVRIADPGNGLSLKGDYWIGD
jgi:hypothetical protein